MISKKISVRIKAKGKETGGELERIVLSAGGFRLAGPADRERPDLLILNGAKSLTKNSSWSSPC